jgi:DMSO reductase family type II enzyme heme b subunit
VEDQQVKGMGQWKNGRWSVVFSRDKKTTSRWDIKFSNGKPVLLAFALWDGDNKDKNANKMVSFWNILTLK